MQNQPPFCLILNSGMVWMIKSNDDPFGIFLADFERGAFKLQNFDVVKGEEKTPRPRRFELAQNHPNPFNPETVIRYSLAEDAQVKLSIQGLRGETIRILRRQFETAGSKSVIGEGRDQNGAAVSSGVYVYVLRTGTEVMSKKMLLVR